MDRPLFRIKICGITNVADAREAADAGADAIGLNFYSGSPRCISEETAEEIVRILPADVAKVGVFVNMPSSDVARLADRLRLDWIQLHGDEPPEVIAELKPRRVIRALPCGKGGLPAVVQYLEKCESEGGLPDALLADAAAGSAYGGTGLTAEWGQLVPPRSWLHSIPLILAGGLRPDNIASAIATVQPDAVDTASGVEVSPGKKDRDRLHAFVNTARHAFA
jgi:phosphoribosylanthranilate isomerase